MRKKLLVVILCASMLFPASVSAEVLGYEATLDTYTKEKKTPQQFQIDDGAGNTVNVLRRVIRFMLQRKIRKSGPIRETVVQSCVL